MFLVIGYGFSGTVELSIFCGFLGEWLRGTVGPGLNLYMSILCSVYYFDRNALRILYLSAKGHCP